ncbi:alpha/beta fold hydrolase [Geodermatophilus ruber]|uniref:4,5:9,10-diseco-3-hydroxy-5,9,17-trioxoandrosta-1(10),2-diene-4-oate hydrolase n=1 Tax=Geodermatophilus ruber TaxID=504800 RepID=A0A1I4GPB4_9ACTN|nr:alpha/beta fold hydrolase [Geodermatophilus ruber]SFL30966.1 4,5:9,10-diseco-3-hydroxy-5,9,17-trioxoandrosta-1(10),2-diene-4-oate hydrolase [Geodermatophilus ruber]
MTAAASVAEGTPFRSRSVVVPQVRALSETVHGVRTHYVEAGEGDPVVLVHGGGPGASGASGWARVLPLLARHFRVLAVDLIGSGHTDKPLIDYSFQTLVEHLAGFVDVLGLRQVRLVGNSQGAYVTVKYALDHPARVEQVGTIGTATLASAVGLRDDGRAVPLPRFDGSRASLVAFLETIVNDPAQLTEELVEARFAVASLPGHREMLDSLWHYRTLLTEDADQQQVFEVGPRLAKLTVPWSIIWGADDRTAPLGSLGAGMRERYPQVPFSVVDGAGHQAQTDQPQQVYELLRTLFGRAPARAA